jgi:hypothetical protein
MILYRADYSENTVVEIDAVGDSRHCAVVYALSLEEAKHWAKTQLTGAPDGDEVEIEKLEITERLSPRKLVCACLNQSGWCKLRILVARLVRKNGRTVNALVVEGLEQPKEEEV